MKNNVMATIRERLLAGSFKNESAPKIFIVLCVYAVLNALYLWAFFGLNAMLIRSAFSLAIIAVYILVERSALSVLCTAFLAPFLMIVIVTAQMFYFSGDILIFTYSNAIAFISLTYLKPKALLAYIILSSAGFAFIIFALQVNMLGAVFTPIFVILYFLVSVALNALIYMFCLSYTKLIRTLHDAKNKASHATQAKGKFLASMSHEIRTPLNAIIGLTTAEMRREELPQATMETLRKINASSGLLLRIINDILDMSKIESGKFEIVPSKYNFADIIYDITALNMMHLQSKPIKFIVSVDKNIPCILIGDDIRIKQVLGNLLSNAFKYTKEGSVELRVLSQEDGDKALLVFEISDTGIGIREDDLNKLFSDYAQVDQKLNRDIEGTGLGLSICKGLVKLMHGKISAKSEYGKGSVFSVCVQQGIADKTPIGQQTADALKNFIYVPADYGYESSFEYIQMPNAKVLIVDDVEINTEVAAASLEPYGIQADCVTSGYEAVRRIELGSPRYDLILMDHLMPGMDGVATALAIRRLGTAYALSVPIVALTANVFANQDNIFIENGFQDYLSKPIDLQKLDAVLRTWLRH